MSSRLLGVVLYFLVVVVALPLSFPAPFNYRKRHNGQTGGFMCEINFRSSTNKDDKPGRSSKYLNENFIRFRKIEERDRRRMRTKEGKQGLKKFFGR